MVAMREDFNSERRVAKPSTRERAGSMNNEDKAKVDMLLAACTRQVAENLITTLSTEQKKLMFLSDEIWQLITIYALFSAVKAANFDARNLEGEKDIICKRIRMYENFANGQLADDFVKMCNVLNNWRDDAAQGA